MPELDKIVQLSRVLGVSTDALLLDELDCFSSIPPELTGPLRGLSLSPKAPEPGGPPHLG